MSPAVATSTRPGADPGHRGALRAESLPIAPPYLRDDTGRNVLDNGDTLSATEKRQSWLGRLRHVAALADPRDVRRQRTTDEDDRMSRPGRCE